MTKHDDSNRRLHELFAAARRADRDELPGFQAVSGGGELGARRWAIARSAFRVAALAAAGGVTIAAVAILLHVAEPGQTPFEGLASSVDGDRIERDASRLPVEITNGTGLPGLAREAAPDAVSAEPQPVQRTAADAPDAGQPSPEPREAALEARETSPVPPEPVADDLESAASAPNPAVPDSGSPSTPVGAGAAGLAVRVVDAHGPLPAASVKISHETGFVRETAVLTDADGIVEFPVLRPGGGYSLEVAFPGFGTQRLRDLRVQINKNTRMTVQLAEELTERVKVTAGGDVVDLEKTTAAIRFSDELIQDLPVPGRFYHNVVVLAPGNQDTDGDGNPNVHGSRERDFKAVVRGINNVDPSTGSYMSQVNPNSVEEMEVITAGAVVEFGRAQGGFSRIVDREGEAEAEVGPGLNTESYAPIAENGFLTALENPLSTFSIDVDTASYSIVRRFLKGGTLPPPDAVRIEEMINYFHYDYPAARGSAPFSASVEIADCPWNPAHRLARIGLQGEAIERGQLAGTNLVFLIDVSGSMGPSVKLPLLKQGMKLLTDQLDGRDRVAIVVYAGNSTVVLPSTPGNGKAEILAAIDSLRAGGSTNGGSGVLMAYETARENFIAGGVNRVILATDGDFNVGTTDKGSLLRLVKRGALDGVSLTALGFGMGNYKDDTLELLADRGNGNYAYIDGIDEARKVLVEEIGGTLVTIAKDVKIQVEFNPAEVGSYRLVGYENRMLRKEDFNDDRKDAGEIGSGHSVTALYEIVPPGGEDRPAPTVDPLKYQAPAAVVESAPAGELLTLKIRYKEPDGDNSRLLEFPILDDGRALDEASADFKFAAAVAQFGMILRRSEHKCDATIAGVRALALQGLGADERGHRAGFIELVDRAGGLVD